mgnify:CR=1 FL=1
MSPLGVFSRMNFGVTLEGLLNKIIKKCETDILTNPDKNINTVLNNLIEVNKVLGNQEYGEKIEKRRIKIDLDSNVFEKGDYKDYVLICKL